MNCIACGKGVEGNRCLSCGTNQDSLIFPEPKVEVVKNPKAPVVEKPDNAKPSKVKDVKAVVKPAVKVATKVVEIPKRSHKKKG